MAASGSNRKIREIVTGIRGGQILARPDFQRRLVWNQKHKNAFIRTILDDYPFPEVYFANGEVDLESGEGVTLIVDGQQRLTTIFEYFSANKELHLESDTPAYHDLTESQKRSFLDYDVVVRDLGAMPLDRVKEVFLRINSTAYALNPMETANARFDGALKKFAERIASSDFFSDWRTFTVNDVRRMNDVRFVLSIVISLMRGYFNRDDLFEQFLSEYNEDFPEAGDIEGRVLGVAKFLEDAGFPARSRIWKKADLFSAFCELGRVDLLACDPNRFKELFESLEILSGLESGSNSEVGAASISLAGVLDLDQAEEYHKAALQASNDRINRIRRGEVLSRLICASMR